MENTIRVSKCVALLAAMLAAAAIPSTAQDTRTGGSTQTRTGTTDTRATPAPPPALPTLNPPAPPPMLIPGGGNSASTPLWIDLTKILCVQENDDDSDGDEVYAMVATVSINWEKLWLSKVDVTTTNVYGQMNREDRRVPNLSVWGFDGSPAPIPLAKDALILVMFFERGSGNVLMAKMLVQAKLMQRVKELHPGDTYSQIVGWLSSVMKDTMFSAVQVAAAGGDNQLGQVQRVSISAEDLEAARTGAVVKKELAFYDTEGYGVPGKYLLRFQLGKAGVSSVPW